MLPVETGKVLLHPLLEAIPSVEKREQSVVVSTKERMQGKLVDERGSAAGGREVHAMVIATARVGVQKRMEEGERTGEKNGTITRFKHGMEQVRVHVHVSVCVYDRVCV